MMRLLKELQEGELITSFALIYTCQIRFKKNGEPYLRLVLGDRSGRMEARLWEGGDRISLKEGDFVKFQARVENYAGTLQLIIQRIRKTKPQDAEQGFDVSNLVPSTEYDPEEMWDSLTRLINRHTIRPQVRSLLNSVLHRYGQEIRTFPAGVEVHHGYRGGYLEHILSVLESVLHFADKHSALDRDLLIAGAVLHDIGKLRELSGSVTPSYTVEGRLIGHIVLGRDLVREEASKISDFPPKLLTLLEHIILSHQGHLEWGSPKRPKIPEAIVLHYIDDLDAKLNRVFRLLRDDQESSEFTRYDRILERMIFKGEYAGEPEGDQEGNGGGGPPPLPES